MMAAIRAYDPRDPDQSADEPATWKATDNPALIAAHVIGGWFDAPVITDYWRNVAAHADIADALIGNGGA